jgi:hypothetical protein
MAAAAVFTGGGQIAVEMREKGAGNVRLAILLLAQVGLRQVVAAIENPPFRVRGEHLRRD